jgi:3'(2'), 5'-bisphosphate nucleotidase
MTFTTAKLADLLSAVLHVADAAGREIMQVYEGDFNVTLKPDRSPLTEADLAAQRVIARSRDWVGMLKGSL